MLTDSAALIGCSAGDAAAAAAAAADGANFILLEGAGAAALAPGVVAEVAAQQRSRLRIPLLVSSSAMEAATVADWLAAGPDGICGTAADLAQLAAAAPTAAAAPDAADAVAVLLDGLRQQGWRASGTEAAAPAGPSSGLLSGLLGGALLDTVLGREKVLMQEILEFLAIAAPEMDESRLLREALAGARHLLGTRTLVRARGSRSAAACCAGLDEPFLLVVVGEFNSGKSSVVNALLGAPFLEEGILPTTNEISILRYTDEDDASVERVRPPLRSGAFLSAATLALSHAAMRCVQTEDGLFVRFLPSDLLQRVNIVDTPGTNVIVDRQQRLTEEFVPRSDLVLFILSADRPFTESEVRFLRYIKRWGKKVVFVINKIDIFDSASDVDAVSAFVTDNARALLGVDTATVLPVSARLALQAKVEAGSAEQHGVLQSLDVESKLEPDTQWQASRFLDLEKYMLDFLTGVPSLWLPSFSQRPHMYAPTCLAQSLRRSRDATSRSVCRHHCRGKHSRCR